MPHAQTRFVPIQEDRPGRLHPGRWRGRAVRLVASCALVLGIGFAEAQARTCGGAFRCACGDTVVESTTLDEDLGPCVGNGLAVAAGQELDCAGHTISGSNLPGAWYGIYLGQAIAAEVRNCKVTAFRRGIRIRGGRDNTIAANEVFANRYGIELARDTTANRLEQNLVRDNRDEGIHLGTGTHANEIVDNEIRYSKRENLYLLRSDRNLVEGNVLHHSRNAAIYVKHSSRNRFVDNEVRDRPLQVRGDSSGNTFEGNYLKGDGYLFEAFEDATGWTYPHGNTMTDDLIRKTDFCFRFFGAYDNHATGLRTDGRCAPMTIAVRGEVDSTDNTVDVEPAR